MEALSDARDTAEYCCVRAEQSKKGHLLRSFVRVGFSVATYLAFLYLQYAVRCDSAPSQDGGSDDHFFLLDVQKTCVSTPFDCCGGTSCLTNGQGVQCHPSVITSCCQGTAGEIWRFR